jgi:hypothetical protein
MSTKTASGTADFPYSLVDLSRFGNGPVTHAHAAIAAAGSFVLELLLQAFCGLLMLLALVTHNVAAHVIEVRRTWAGWRNELAYWTSGAVCLLGCVVYFPKALREGIVYGGGR